MNKAPFLHDTTITGDESLDRTNHRSEKTRCDAVRGEWWVSAEALTLTRVMKKEESRR